ncbi:MAG: hypothetical protein SGPRY_012015 [Prymnesium sp.]
MAFTLLCAHSTPQITLRTEERRLQAQLLFTAMSRGERWHEEAAKALMHVASTLDSDNLEEFLHSSFHADSPALRLAAIRSLLSVATLNSAHARSSTPLAVRLWLLQSDDDPACAASAEAVWRRYHTTASEEDGGQVELPSALEEELLPLLGNVCARQRAQAARALAAAARCRPTLVHTTLTRLFELHKKNTTPAVPNNQPLPRRLAGGEEEDAGWVVRHGVALALGALAGELKAREQLPVVFAFLKRALGDSNEVVAQARQKGSHMAASGVVQAGREIIEKQQQPDEMVGMLVPMFEAFLAEPATTELHDRIRQANLHTRHSPYRRPGFALRLMTIFLSYTT